MKSYMERLAASLDLALADLERSKSRLSRLPSIISGNAAKVGPISLLTINRRPYIASPMAS